MKFVKNVIVVNCKVYGSFLWTIFIMLLCFSCTNSSDKGLKFKNPQSISGHSQLVMNEKANPTIINLIFKDSLDTGFDWDYIIDNIHAIPLETNSEFLIGEISSVLFTDTTIFIRDKKTDYLTCFNRKGKALFKISNKGSGPNEYRSITDVYIDDWTKTINIYDNIGGKIVSYSLSDGSFIGNKKYVGKFL